MKKFNLIFVSHIRDSINKIIKYTDNISYEEFVSNDMIQDAVIRQIEILGEASKNLTDDFKNTYNYLSWKQMVGMRNKVIHEYFGVNLKVIWDTVKLEIPGLKTSIEKIITNETPKTPLGL